MKLMNRNLNFDSFAYAFLAIAVAFTVLGPVVHYVFGSLALVCLIIARIRKENTFCVYKLGKNEKHTLIFLLLFGLWAMFPHAWLCRDFHTWGKSASVALEALLFVFMSAMLFNTDERRERLLDVTIIFNALYSIDLIRRCIGIHPEIGFNGAIIQVCMAGNYAIYILPLSIAYYAYAKKNFIIRALSLFITLVLVFTSFSAGAWIAAFAEIAVLIIYAFAKKLITPNSCRNIAITMVILVCAFCGFYVASDYATKGRVSEWANREVGQIFALHNTEKLTTNRYQSWVAGLYLVKQHPFLGYGRDTFQQNIINNLDKMPKDLVLPKELVNDHGHNMLLMTVYSWGLPALVFFLVALWLSFLKIYKIAKVRLLDNETYNWELAELLLIVGMLVVGLGGDLFEGRRDIAVLFYGYWGLFIALPMNYSDTHTDKTGACGK